MCPEPTVGEWDESEGWCGMTGARNVHALAATLERLRREALAGSCELHPDRPAVAVIESVTFPAPKGACEMCALFGNANGYAVHRDLEAGDA